MSKTQEMHYKEVSPESTVERVKSLLSDIGVELCEEIIPESSIGTFSMRVNIKGTTMGTNGKGVTPQFARASAYAEFLERLQNLLFDPCCFFSDKSHGFFHYIDEKVMDSREVAAIDNAFMKLYWRLQGLSRATPEEKAHRILDITRNEDSFTCPTDQYEVRPYYNVTKKRVEDAPYLLVHNHYGSNGMCAGNSPEEALIQGLSEILERYVQKLMFRDRLSFPMVPEPEIAKYPYVYDIYKKLKDLDGYYICMKDCSMGGRFPVAALVVAKKDSGRFGVKFGCHPDFGVAMERTMTEASQGMDVKMYANGNSVNFGNPGLDDPINIFNSFKFGTGVYPYQLLNEKSRFEYTPVRDASQMTNAQILRHMAELIESEGFELWVRDVSYLEFSAYHIIVPGMSELFNISDLHQRAINTRFYLMKYLNNPELINEKTCRLLRGLLDFWSSSKIDNRMRYTYMVAVNFKLPGEEVHMGWLYMSAMCCAYLDEYDQAATRLMNLVLTMKSVEYVPDSTVPMDELPFYVSVYQYLSARAHGLSHDEALDYMVVLCSPDICEKINNIFSDKSKIFVSQYPKHDYNNRESCMENRCCDLHAMLDCTAKFKVKQIENPINQADLQKVFDAVEPA